MKQCSDGMCCYHVAEKGVKTFGQDWDKGRIGEDLFTYPCGGSLVSVTACIYSSIAGCTAFAT